MKNNFIVCAYRDWNIQLFHETLIHYSGNWFLINKETELTKERIAEINPEFIFFLDWSWIVPEDIYSKYKCVVFHAAPLPLFRGGSPIQNQIVRGIRQTKLTAFFMAEGIDAGDILLQEDLSLEGHLRDITSRITALFPKMIEKIINCDYTLIKQNLNEGSLFKRRKPEESELKPEDFEKPQSYIYDFIRMLEEPYPNAFLVVGNKKIVFKEAEYCCITNKILVKTEIIENSKTTKNE